MPPIGANHRPNKKGRSLERPSDLSLFNFYILPTTICHMLSAICQLPTANCIFSPYCPATVNTVPALRPNTSGKYISHARAGSVRNSPLTLARIM
jgi:hypothetical protein